MNPFTLLVSSFYGYSGVEWILVSSSVFKQIDEWKKLSWFCWMYVQYYTD